MAVPCPSPIYAACRRCQRNKQGLSTTIVLECYSTTIDLLQSTTASQLLVHQQLSMVAEQALHALSLTSPWLAARNKAPGARSVQLTARVRGVASQRRSSQEEDEEETAAEGNQFRTESGPGCLSRCVWGCGKTLRTAKPSPRVRRPCSSPVPAVQPWQDSCACCHLLTVSSP